ncbi:TRAP dicarboxylate transporter, DctQ subunit, unknown substrate 6 [hydrothermal vent metagenome]|uniref:Tripartite ATP-independent periplasmic transporters DctQ component domain-containing protein n=1 Tax=hydrothermal vent metagenome TaxID=652676 RepID=A0A3B0ZBZ3_9ZZZZ
MTLNRIIQPLEAINEKVGQAISWLSLGVVLLTFTVVVLRYGFDIGWIWMQESVTYMYAWIFMLAAGYTLKHEGHVRVDIFYRQFNPRQQAWVNLLGSLFLLFPMFIFIAWISFDYVLTSWRISEASGEAGGLAFVYLLKTSLFLMPLLVLLQGAAMILGSIEILLNNSAGTPANKHPQESAS